MTLTKKLSNPFALALEGFVVGAILFSVVPAKHHHAAVSSAPVSAYEVDKA